MMGIEPMNDTHTDATDFHIYGGQCYLEHRRELERKHFRIIITLALLNSLPGVQLRRSR